MLSPIGTIEGFGRPAGALFDYGCPLPRVPTASTHPGHFRFAPTVLRPAPVATITRPKGLLMLGAGFRRLYLTGRLIRSGVSGRVVCLYRRDAENPRPLELPALAVRASMAELDNGFMGRRCFDLRCQTIVLQAVMYSIPHDRSSAALGFRPRHAPGLEALVSTAPYDSHPCRTKKRSAVFLCVVNFPGPCATANSGTLRLTEAISNQRSAISKRKKLTLTGTARLLVRRLFARRGEARRSPAARYAETKACRSLAVPGLSVLQVLCLFGFG